MSAPDTQPAPRLLTSIKHSLIYLVLIPIVASVLVSWISYQRIKEYRDSQLSIAKTVVRSTALEISRKIKEQKKLLGIFAENERYYIKKLVSEPDNEVFEDIIAKKLRYYFPKYFAFTVVDQYGNLITEDYNGYIGDICVHDIMNFANSGDERIQVHPNPYAHHTDAIVKIGKKKQDGYFFTSFATDSFSRILSLSSPAGQHLMLINSQTPNLIEIVETGARNVLDRDSYVLTDEEQQRILFSRPVEGAKWNLLSMHDEDLFVRYEQQVITIAAIIILIFVLSSVFMIITLCRGEKQRIALQQTKQEMFSFFTHDLRSPLTSIYGTLQLLEIDTDRYHFNKNTKEMLSSAIINSEHMITLINDLLDIQKLESGNMSFNYEKAELNQFIIDTIKLNQRFAEMQSVRIEFKATDKLYANIDKRRFQQVLTNLLSNAIKYSPENEVVTVSLDKQDSFAILSVADNGPGVNLDVQHSLFDKFTQSDSQITHETGGTGLGLSIVRYIVQKHRGNVSFESTIGQGSKFIIKIPLF